MQRAQQRDAARSQRFFFRKNIYALGRSGSSSTASSSGSVSPVESIPRKKERKLRNCFPPIPIPENGVLEHRQSVEQEYEEMTLDEIMNGKVSLYVASWDDDEQYGFQGDDFPGLIGLVHAYIDTLDVGIDEMAKIKRYLDVIRLRSRGDKHRRIFRFGIESGYRRAANPCYMDTGLCEVPSIL